MAQPGLGGAQANRTKMKCYGCGHYGHWWWDCKRTGSLYPCNTFAYEAYLLMEEHLFLDDCFFCDRSEKEELARARAQEEAEAKASPGGKHAPSQGN